MKRIEIPGNPPVTVYVGEPAPGEHPLAQQAASSARDGGTSLPKSLMDQFTTLAEVAARRGVNLGELAARFWAEPVNVEITDLLIPPPSVLYAQELSGRMRRLTDADPAWTETFVITIDHGTSTDGRPYWMYIAVRSNRYKEFVSLVAARATVRFKDFGIILEYGYERTMTPAKRAEVHEKYGIDEAYVDELIAVNESARAEYLARVTELAAERIAGDLPRS